jgi:hypothetical protein
MKKLYDKKKKKKIKIQPGKNFYSQFNRRFSIFSPVCPPSLNVAEFCPFLSSSFFILIVFSSFDSYDRSLLSHPDLSVVFVVLCYFLIIFFPLSFRLMLLLTSFLFLPSTLLPQTLIASSTCNSIN